MSVVSQITAPNASVASLEAQAQTDIERQYINDAATISQITDNIYVSGWLAAVDQNALMTNEIKTIVCINETQKSTEQLEMYRRLGINHIFINELDAIDTDLFKYFDKLYLQIAAEDAAHHHVLVHCTAGISRSCTVTIAYLLRKAYETRERSAHTVSPPYLGSIINFVKSKRPMCEPNDGFLRQLAAYEIHLTPKHNDNTLKIIATIVIGVLTYTLFKKK